MVREKDILNGLCKAPCSVPKGYFAELQGRLVSIPESQAQTSSPLRKVAPALALAASFAIAVVAGTLILGHPATESPVTAVSEDFLYEQLRYADAIPATYSLEDFYEEAAAAEDMSLEEYIESINQ